MAREYFCAYHSYLQDMKRLSDEEVGRLFRALLKYSSTGELDELIGNEKFYIDHMIGQIDRDRSKYIARCEKNRINGSIGGKANASERKRMLTNASERYQMPPKDKEKEKEKDKEKDNIPPFIPPMGETGFSESLQLAFLNWINYKKEKRQSYKSRGIMALVTQIKNNVEKYGEEAVIEVIVESMANNWQGIAFDKLQKNGGQKDGKDSGHPKKKWNLEQLIL